MNPSLFFIKRIKQEDETSPDKLPGMVSLIRPQFSRPSLIYFYILYNFNEPI